MVDLHTEASVTDSVSIEMEYGIVVCDSVEVVDRVVILPTITRAWLDIPYFAVSFEAPARISRYARGPPS
jgi:hypothetical protein